MSSANMRSQANFSDKLMRIRYVDILEEPAPQKGRFCTVRRGGSEHGDNRIVVNAYGFKRVYANEIDAAKAIGCDPDRIMDKLSSNRDSLCFVTVYEKGEVFYA